MEFNIYAGMVIMSVIMLVILIVIGRKQNITEYLLIFVSIMICCIGYYTVSISESLEAAIIGHRLVYLGGVFSPVFLLFGEMKLCKLKIYKIPVIVLIAYSVVVLCFAFTVEEGTCYYTNVSLGKGLGMTYLIKEYGPAHILYPIHLICNMVAMFGNLIYAFIKKNVSRRVTILFTVAELITGGLYFMGRIIDTPIEWYVIAYFFDEILFLVLIRRVGMYDMSETIAKALNENAVYGYIVLDEKMRYLSSNSVAEEYFPELKKQKIDTPFIPKSAPVICEKFGDWMNNPREDSFKFEIEDSDLFLKCSIKSLYHGKWKKEIGYFIELIDETQQQRYMTLLNHYNANLEQEVIKKTEHINLMQDKIVLGMADMVENRDSNTGGHIKRTSQVIKIFTKELKQHKEYGFTEKFLEYVAKAAPMHDLGKIAVDDRVLRKPGSFTPEEFEEMKKHSEKGAEIVTQILDGVNDEEFVAIARNIAHYHHEKWNGQGYPEQLSGIDIPLEARIMALADVFDALVSKRCYKEKMDYDKAFEIIEESLGSHFDPELGKLFLKCRENLEAYYDSVETE